MADLTVKINKPVNFNDASTNATEYVWTFGDGNTSIEKSPTHAYNAIGLYNITHSAINSCPNGTSTCTGKTVEVVADTQPKSSTPIVLGASLLGLLWMFKK